MKKLICFALASAGALLVLTAQDARIVVDRTQGRVPVIAIPDFRGSGDAQRFMVAFNETLNGDVNGSGLVKIVPKTSLPLFVPQQPSDFQQPGPPAAAAPVRGRTPQAAQQITQAANGGGHWMQDWSSPARPGQLPGFRVHRRTKRRFRSAGLAL